MSLLFICVVSYTTITGNISPLCTNKNRKFIFNIFPIFAFTQIHEILEHKQHILLNSYMTLHVPYSKTNPLKSSGNEVQKFCILPVTFNYLFQRRDLCEVILF